MRKIYIRKLSPEIKFVLIKHRKKLFKITWNGFSFNLLDHWSIYEYEYKVNKKFLYQSAYLLFQQAYTSSRWLNKEHLKYIRKIKKVLVYS